MFRHGITYSITTSVFFFCGESQPYYDGNRLGYWIMVRFFYYPLQHNPFIKLRLAVVAPRGADLKKKMPGR